MKSYSRKMILWINNRLLTSKGKPGPHFWEVKIPHMPLELTKAGRDSSASWATGDRWKECGKRTCPAPTAPSFDYCHEAREYPGSGPRPRSSSHPWQLLGAWHCCSGWHAKEPTEVSIEIILKRDAWIHFSLISSSSASAQQCWSLFPILGVMPPSRWSVIKSPLKGKTEDRESYEKPSSGGWFWQQLSRRQPKMPGTR